MRGGALWSGLMSKAIPMAFKWAPKIAAPLTTGALQALGSLGLDKILGSGGGQITTFSSIPEFINKPTKK